MKKDTLTKVISHLAESIGDPEVDKIADWWDNWVGVMRHAPELKPQTMCIFTAQSAPAENSILSILREEIIGKAADTWNKWNASLTEESTPDFALSFDEQPSCAQSEAIIALYKAGNR